ncbi:hypothetical protein [Chitinophaga sp.]|nr:hypothetical protein [Chitinophaga sp.]
MILQTSICQVGASLKWKVRVVQKEQKTPNVKKLRHWRYAP